MANEQVLATTQELLAVLPLLNRIVATEVRREAGEDTTMPQFRVLAHLAPGQLTLSALAKRRRVSLQSMSELVQVLVERGWVVRAPDPADRRPLPSPAHVQLQWLDSGAALLDAVRALPLPAGEGYAWCAGEARLMAQLRHTLVHEKGHPAQAIRAAAYWKQGATAHHENLED